MGSTLPAAPTAAATSGQSTPLLTPYEIAWTKNLDPAWSGPVSVTAGRSYLIVSSRFGPVTGRNLENGDGVWTTQIAPEVAPIAGDGLVFVVGSGGSVRALDEATGAERWRAPVSTTQVVPLWHAWLAVASPVVPTWHAGWLLVASGTGVRAYRAVDGAAIWEKDLGAPVVQSLAIDGDRAFAALADQRLVSLDITTGATRWDVSLASLPGPLLAANDRLYFGAADSLFHCYAQDNGTRQWDFRARVEVVGAPVTSGDLIFFAALDNTVRALDRSGRMQWVTSLTTRPAQRVFVEGGHVVIPLTSGDLVLELAKDRRPAGRLPAPRPANAPMGLVVRLEDVARAGPQQLFRITASSAGRTLVAYRRGVLALGSAATLLGTPVDLREPHQPPAHR